MNGPHVDAVKNSGLTISEQMNAKAGRPPLEFLPNHVVELCRLRNAGWLNGKRADVYQ